MKKALSIPQLIFNELIVCIVKLRSNRSNIIADYYTFYDKRFTGNLR